MIMILGMENVPTIIPQCPTLFIDGNPHPLLRRGQDDFLPTQIHPGGCYLTFWPVMYNWPLSTERMVFLKFSLGIRGLH